MNTTINRPGVPGTVAATAAAGTTPAIDTTGLTPFRAAEARYKAAVAHFQSLPEDLEDTDRRRFIHEERLLIDASRVVEAASVANWQEYADLFAIACDSGLSLVMEDTMRKLFADAQRLAGRA